MNHHATRNLSAAALPHLVVSIEIHQDRLRAAQKQRLPKPFEPDLIDLGLVLASGFRGAVEAYADGLGDTVLPPSLLALARWGRVVPPKHTALVHCHVPDQRGSQAA